MKFLKHIQRILFHFQTIHLHKVICNLNFTFIKLEIILLKLLLYQNYNNYKYLDLANYLKGYFISLIILLYS